MLPLHVRCAQLEVRCWTRTAKGMLPADSMSCRSTFVCVCARVANAGRLRAEVRGDKRMRLLAGAHVQRLRAQHGGNGGSGREESVRGPRHVLMEQTVSVHLCHRREATNDVSVPTFESRSKHCVTKTTAAFS